jgi:hypothetical protein
MVGSGDRLQLHNDPAPITPLLYEPQADVPVVNA